jgi:hypothetical protein
MDDVRSELSAMMPPLTKREKVGQAEVLQVFNRNAKSGGAKKTIAAAGCKVLLLKFHIPCS